MVILFHHSNETEVKAQSRELIVKSFGKFICIFFASTCKQLDHIIHGHALSANSKPSLQDLLKRSRKIKQRMQTSE